MSGTLVRSKPHGPARVCVNVSLCSSTATWTGRYTADCEILFNQITFTFCPRLDCGSTFHRLIAGPIHSGTAQNSNNVATVDVFMTANKGHFAWARHESNRKTPDPSSVWFALPAPVRHIFDRLPIKAYPSNTLPQRSPEDIEDHVLYVFAHHANQISFNPACLRWQVCIRTADQAYILTT